MKIVIAPDSFKGNLPAASVCEAIAAGLHDVDPAVTIVSMPLADGGEGTARAITNAAGGEFRRVQVKGPLGDPVQAEFGLIRGGKTAVLDMASASGIELLKADRLNPMKTSTWGTGELIHAALESGAKELVLGIGGSATNDGGVGMALALGFDVLDAEGNPVPLGGEGLASIASVKCDRRDPLLEGVSILIACDVTNPLLGPKGATRTFGPQKGATAETIPFLEAGLSKLANAWKGAGLADNVDQPGDGAAGGLGAALRVLLKAEMRSGARTVMEYAGFDKAIADASLVITGEGMTDSQTAGGKLCSVVASQCRLSHVPIALLSGGLGGEVSQLLETFDYAVSTSCGQVTLEAMMRDAPRDLRFAAANLLRAWKLGAASAKNR